MAKEMKVFDAEFTVTFSHTLIAKSPEYARQKLQYLWDHAQPSEKWVLVRASDIDSAVIGTARFREAVIVGQEPVIVGQEPQARQLHGTRRSGWPEGRRAASDILAGAAVRVNTAASG